MFECFTWPFGIQGNSIWLIIASGKHSYSNYHCALKFKLWPFIATQMNGISIIISRIDNLWRNSVNNWKPNGFPFRLILFRCVLQHWAIVLIIFGPQIATLISHHVKHIHIKIAWRYDEYDLIPLGYSAISIFFFKGSIAFSHCFVFSMPHITCKAKPLRKLKSFQKIFLPHILKLLSATINIQRTHDHEFNLKLS